jgi:PelA/Pel-15E family pectate lyase
MHRRTFLIRAGALAGAALVPRLAALAEAPAPTLGGGPSTSAEPISRTRILAAMKRATTFMVEKVSTRGGYVWSYLPDLSRRWGELEARPTMIWIQPPGTATMGHLFLDAYHATGDEYYYTAAERAADALIAAQHGSGGWNYVADFAGERSLREWYDTVGRNAWRLEEFQHYWGNATFDDAGTAESAKLLLRLFLEKRVAKFRGPLEKSIGFVLDSQYPIGAWPQRYPLTQGVLRHGNADYTSYLTFNDDVSAQNIEVLLMYYGALQEPRVLDPIRRAMDVFVRLQLPRPQAGWALQYTPDLEPAGARTYEPKALVTHTTATNIELLIKFYTLTGDATFLRRIPEALAWLESVGLPPGVAPPGRTHPTFVEPGANRPLYVHREGSNVFNGRYFVDRNPKNTIAHYSSFRRIDLPRLRALYEETAARSPAEVTAGSPLRPGARVPLPRFFAVSGADSSSLDAVIGALKGDGSWVAPLGMNSHPYREDGSGTVAPGDYSQTHVGDETDTSPFPDDTIEGISTSAYIRNMSVLIRALDEGERSQTGRAR